MGGFQVSVHLSSVLVSSEIHPLWTYTAGIGRDA